MNSRAIFAGAFGAISALLAYGSAAVADPVTGTLAIQYFDVAHGTGGPDFANDSQGGTGTPNVAALSTLGPNGLPVATAPFGVSSINPVTNEITWWSPTLNSSVMATGSNPSVAIPFASNMFAPNSTGGDNTQAFETAILTGTFTLASPGTVNFTVGSDDDAFIYVNGVLVGQNPGIHGVSDVTFTANGISGVNTLEIFYADRREIAAELDISADVTLSSGVPEPSTWAMMILGFLGVGFMAYRRKGQTALRIV